jgi:hypothetical protein
MITSRLSDQLFRAIGGDQKAGTSSLKRVSVRIFRINVFRKAIK